MKVHIMQFSMGEVTDIYHDKWKGLKAFSSLESAQKYAKKYAQRLGAINPIQWTIHNNNTRYIGMFETIDIGLLAVSITTIEIED